ncbi:MAG: hypothetical protein R2822_16940 [Spirosomataceae bacterium]
MKKISAIFLFVLLSGFFQSYIFIDGDAASTLSLMIPVILIYVVLTNSK